VRAADTLAALGAALGDLLGRRCHGCGAVAPGRGRGELPPLCADCARELAPWAGPTCPGCGAMFQGATGGAGHLCAACRLEPRPWERLLFYGPYQGLLRRLVLDYKFHGRLGAQRLLCGLARAAWLRGSTAAAGEPLAARGAGEPQAVPDAADAPAMPDLVVPVPLHSRRLQHRGFNQSLELARGVGRLLGRPIPVDALTRVRYTVPQMTLTAARRRDNVRGAFGADPGALAGRRVLLVDDVMTTGGTLEECARTLLRAGAAGVVVLVLARTPAGR